MTNKEAITLIQEIEEDGRNVTSEHMEALDFAIKAIEEKEEMESAIEWWRKKTGVENE